MSLEAKQGTMSPGTSLGSSFFIGDVMPALKTIRMTLTGPYRGETKLFNGKYQFVDGITYFSGNDEQIAGVSRYFTRSYQVKVEVVTDEELKTEIRAAAEEAEAEKPEAVRVDDSAVISDEQEDEPVEPNARQAEIIAAVNHIDKDEWVDLQAETPHPKTKEVQELVGDPTIKKVEIIEVIKTWLS